MKTFLRHKLALLQLETKITDCEIQKEIWKEIDANDSVKKYQEQINVLEHDKEHYLNQLLLSLNKTKITLENVNELKQCYQLIEQYSKIHYSTLYTAHLKRTIEIHEKEYGDQVLRTQFSKANQTELLITGLQNQL